MKTKKYLKLGFLIASLSALVFVVNLSNSRAANTVLSIQTGGWAYNGQEQVRESTQIRYMLDLVAGNGGVTGQASGRNSEYQFKAKNSAVFSLDGVNIGTEMTIVHRQDWVGVTNNLCASDILKCNFIANWGRSAKTITVTSPNKAVRRGTYPMAEVGGWAYNGHEQYSEGEAIGQALSLAGGNGGVSCWSNYRLSRCQFTATNGVKFNKEGTIIGDKMTIMHTQDYVWVANNLCELETVSTCSGEEESSFFCGSSVQPASSCSVIDEWGRFNKPFGVNIPALTDICCAAGCRSKPASCTNQPIVDPQNPCPVGYTFDGNRCTASVVTQPNPTTTTTPTTPVVPITTPVTPTTPTVPVAPPPPPPPPPVNGKTGTACNKLTSDDSVTFLSKGGLCEAGSVGSFQKTFDTYSWTCYGYNGGGNQSCSAPRIVNNVGGSSCAVSFYTKPTGNLCAEGPAPIVSGNGPWTWECPGNNGGTSAKCVADKKENGSCGSVANDSYGTAPTTNQCSGGSATQSSIDGSGKFWQWSCNGLNGGNSLSCKTANSCGNLKCERDKGENRANCSSDCKPVVDSVNEI